MKKTLCLLFTMAALLLLPACTAEQPSPVSVPSIPEIDFGIHGRQYTTIEEALTATWVGDSSTIVVVGTPTDEIVHTGGAGSRCVVDVKRFLCGEETEVLLMQTFGTELIAGKEYLMILQWQGIDHVYAVAGTANQCAFWLRKGELWGNDQALLTEIYTDTGGNIKTMDELADYFTARLAALETTE
ncbi:MAG: hypothetical protein IKU17_06750 [Clostridia bacterium]|nr:hypothetical protein [Clostridia bacterium]